MKKVFLSAVLGLFVSFASLSSAQAADPCLPTSRIKAIAASCYSETTGLYHSVLIQTMASKNDCPAERRKEVTSAEIEVSSWPTPRDPMVIAGKMSIRPPFYTFTVTNADNTMGDFRSEAFGLDLKDCAIGSILGGLSGGN